MTLVLRKDMDWLLDQLPREEYHLTGAAREVMDVLSRRGASFLSDIASRIHRLPSEIEEALWQLAALGLATADNLDALRQRIRGNTGHGRRDLRRARAHQRPQYSRWSLLEANNPHPDPVELRAHQLLKRYGILFPELLAREPIAPRWRSLAQALRRLEARGDIRGGRFVAGFVGEQFALPEAVEVLRRIKNSESAGQLIVISACDPLNLVGLSTPGQRVPAVLGNRIVFRDGVPLCSLESGRLIDRAAVDDATIAQARSLLHPAHRRLSYSALV